MKLSARDSRFRIFYIIPHEPQDLADSSPLGWYTPGLHDAALPLMLAARLPADIREPYANPEEILPLRLLRDIWPAITPLQIDALRSVQSMLPSPFRVYITNRQVVADAVDEMFHDSPIPYLHASTYPDKNRIGLEHLDRNRIIDFVERVLKVLQALPKWEIFAAEARKAMPLLERRSVRRHRLKGGNHNVVLPNEVALTALGWRLSADDPVVREGKQWPAKARYIKKICLSADAVFDERRRLLGAAQHVIDYRYILAVPAVYWDHYVHWRDRVQRIAKYQGPEGPNLQQKRLVRQSYLAAIRQKTYFDSYEVDDRKHLRLISELSRQRAADMRAFTGGLACLASASLAPVLRLEPQLNEVRADLKVLAEFIRHPGRHHRNWKQSRLMQRLGTRMRSLVDEEFLRRIDHVRNDVPIEGMKLICDLPLEWLPTSGLPLSLRFDTSRIPVIPGNMYIANCLMPPVVLPMQAFEKVLIVRSYEEEDPIKNLLRDQVLSDDRIADMVKFVDVTDEDEFVAALQGYEGACLMFDGHGSYQSEDGSGQIVLGGKAVDSWRLRERCKFPPIVVFSACDTQPLDGAHTSSATGAFVLGARTVLGTSLPIDGLVAATFVRRLLFRIREFIPIALDWRPLVTWREVVSGMLRMAHVTDLLLVLHSAGAVRTSRSDMDAIQLAANVAINNRQTDWYDRFLGEFADRTGLTVAILQEMIAQCAALTESMKYVQLGAPENVLIAKRLPEDVLQEEISKVAPGMVV